MTCTVCGTKADVREYKVTGRTMAARRLPYCPDCAELVQQILPAHSMSAPAIYVVPVPAERAAAVPR